MSLLCRFGIHDWNSWADKHTANYSDSGYLKEVYLIQERFCRKCGKRIFRQEKICKEIS